MYVCQSIFFITSDRTISEKVGCYLSENGYRVEIASIYEIAVTKKWLAAYDMWIMDLELSIEGGHDCLREIRRESDEPIIVLTPPGDKIERIVSLEAGADACVSKPFDPRELLAVVRALARFRTRANVKEGDDRAQRIQFGGWTLGLSTRILVAPDKSRILLTAAEFDLLAALAANPGRILSRSKLIELTRGSDVGPYERTIDALIGRIRARIETDRRHPQIIKTVRGVGYVLTPN